MNLSKSHDPNSFNKILSLHDADKHFRGNDGLSFVQTKLKSLIVRHGVTLVFGVALVHRHFDLDEGTILVEKDNISAPWRYDGSFAKHGGRLIPSAWFYDEGIPRPYEYRFSPYSTADPPTLEEHARFVEEFFSIVNLHGMGSSVGLRLLSGHESTEMLECTEGKVNIMFSSKEVPIEYFQNGTDTMWFFDGQPPHRMYRCICTNTGSSSNPNHNHIDQP